MYVLHFILILLLSSAALVLVEGQSQYVMPLEGPTWDHPIISALVIPQPNETWWNPTYVNSTLRAISEWNNGLSYFAQNYSDFAYLSELNMTPEVPNSTIQSFDVQISWIERFGNETCDAGLTRTTYSTSGIILNSTVSLSAYDCLGNKLSEVDMQNVALHELGHCWGLGHANVTADTMYFSYSLGSPVKALSTLDAYGVANVFRWMANSSEFNPDNQGQQEFSVTLPSTIGFRYLPISQENLPPQSPLDTTISAANDVLQYILMPMVLVTIIVIISVIVIVGLWSRKRRRSERSSR